MNNKDSKSKVLDMGHGEEVVEQLNPTSIDCLPDDLLVQILSFLPMKQAASTSLLSKRWRTLFAFTHNLDFDDHPIVSNHDWWDQSKRRGIQKRFRDFMYRTLALQGGCNTKKLSLKLKTYNTSIMVVENRWISYALKHGVSELYLCIDRDTSFLSRVFTTTTLVKLSLGTRFFLDSVPSDTCLPALKVLLLDSICFEGNELLNVLLAGCPILEDLTIHHKCCTHFPNVISCKTITKLSVTCYYSTIISLDTPNVVDLYYSDYPRHESPHCQLDSLVKATLDLHFVEDNNLQALNGTDVTNLMSGIRNVKTLHLTISAVEVISVCCKGGLPMFKNLVALMFSSKKRDWKVLPLLLERSPNLKKLTLSGLHRYTFGRRHRFVGIQIPAKNQINMLSIMQYQGSENELKHISHFLLNMECLEVVKVYVAAEMDDFRKMQLTEDMLKLPTASSKLKIQVTWSSASIYKSSYVFNN